LSQPDLFLIGKTVPGSKASEQPHDNSATRSKDKRELGADFTPSFLALQEPEVAKLIPMGFGD
jgi:hypothetical protein